MDSRYLANEFLGENFTCSVSVTLKKYLVHRVHLFEALIFCQNIGFVKKVFLEFSLTAATSTELNFQVSSKCKYYDKFTENVTNCTVEFLKEL